MSMPVRCINPGKTVSSRSASISLITRACSRTGNTCAWDKDAALTSAAISSRFMTSPKKCAYSTFSQISLRRMNQGVMGPS